MRKVADCRTMPSESGCSLTIAGTEDEVVAAAIDHAVAAHGHEDTPELRRAVRESLADEGPAGRYGTVMVATVVGSVEELLRASAEWAAEQRAPGFLSEEALLSDDGRTLVTPVFFESKEHYQRLADDPEQDAWWSTRFAPHLTDVRWIDGIWHRTISRPLPPPLVTAGG